jgi:FkbM family methyltransferase
MILAGAGKGLRFDPANGSLRYLLGPIIRYEEELLVKYLSPGAVFYDIGANIGFYAIVGGRIVGAGGHVYAFEPFPESAEAIRNNARLNRFAQVTVEEAAVSDHSGELFLELKGQSEIHKLTDKRDENKNGIMVPVVALDDYISDRKGRAPSLVMIDVEGAELEVLAGMERTMQEHRPVIVCEIHWLVDQLNAFCAAHLDRLGYVIKRVDGGDLPTEPIWYHALFLPKEHPDAAKV